MKRLYRLVINGSWPVDLEEDKVAGLQQSDLQKLYEHCEVNPYDFDDMTLRLERADAAYEAKYAGATDDEEEEEA